MAYITKKQRTLYFINNQLMKEFRQENAHTERYASGKILVKVDINCPTSYCVRSRLSAILTVNFDISSV